MKKLNPLVDRVSLQNKINKISKCYEGFLSAYIWGTAITEDYDSLASDIDIILIFSFLKKKKIENDIRRIFSQGSNIRFRLLLLDELKDGKMRSVLGRLVHPKILANDFRHWLYFSGKKLSPISFINSSTEEIIDLRFQAINSRHILDSRKDNRNVEYFCKELIRIIHLISQLKHGIYPFSYTKIQSTANRAIDNFLKNLITIKKNGYIVQDIEGFIKQTNNFEKKVKKILLMSNLGKMGA